MTCISTFLLKSPFATAVMMVPISRNTFWYVALICAFFSISRFSCSMFEELPRVSNAALVASCWCVSCDVMPSIKSRWLRISCACWSICSRKNANCSSVSCRVCASPSFLARRLLTQLAERCLGASLPAPATALFGVVGVSTDPNAEDSGSLGVMGSELVPLAALASRSCIRAAKLVSSRSRVRFSTVSSPGSDILESRTPLAMADVGKECSSTGVYCLAKLERMLATAADVS